MVILVLSALLFIVAIGGYVSVAYFPQRTEQCTITEKYIARQKDSNTYRFVTEECGTLEAAGWPVGTFNTADTYATLKVGTTYDMDLRGRRIGVLSNFPAIVEYRAVSS